MAYYFGDYLTRDECNRYQDIMDQLIAMRSQRKITIDFDRQLLEHEIAELIDRAQLRYLAESTTTVPN